jgi:hypothetical protein
LKNFLLLEVAYFSGNAIVMRHFISTMLKLQTASFIIIILIHVTISCNQPNQANALKGGAMKTDNYKVGDCFEFKEKIKDFGVIFLEEKVYPDGKQYNLFPVKLDTSKIGLDKFKYGKVYITSFPDFTKSNGRTDGFMVYHFLYQKDFETINKFFSYVGTIPIKDEYKNATGGTVASNFDEFRTQLNLWDKMFDNNGRLVSITEITP